MVTTTVHLMRHGEVHNPDGVLYGRLPEFRLSDSGQAMAQCVADFLAGRAGQAGDSAATVDSGRPSGSEVARSDIHAVIASPLLRAQQTATPIAAAFDLPVQTDDRLLEATNRFEGNVVDSRFLANPKRWPALYNPAKPSWGEPYRQLIARMVAAIEAARRQVAGHEALLVSHQLPIWITRLHLEGRRLMHNPRRRQCGLASLTSLRFEDARLVGIGYREPAKHLVSGGALT